MTHTFPDIPLTLVGHHATVRRGGEAVASGMVSRIDLSNAQGRPMMAHVSFDGQLVMATMRSDDDYTIEVG